MDTVSILITPHGDPYNKQHSGRCTELWGAFAIIAQNNQDPQLLIALTWNLEQCIEWLLDNITFLREAPLAIPGYRVDADESLAAAIVRIRDTAVDAEHDQAVEMLNHYYQQHCISFGLRGIMIDTDIIIGMNHGQSEISSAVAAPGPWRYRFNSDQFWATLWSQIRTFLTWWEQHQPSVDHQQLAQQLLQRVNSVGQGHGL